MMIEPDAHQEVRHAVRQLCSHFPDAYCGYGPEGSGPYRDKNACDPLILREAGLLSVTGSPDEPAKAETSSRATSNKPQETPT